MSGQVEEVMLLLHATVVREMLTKFRVWVTLKHVAPVFHLHGQTEASGGPTAEANSGFCSIEPQKM